MLGIQINGEFLDLPPQASMELYEENPFLQFANENTLGNYSLPIEFLANDRNMRICGFAGIIHKRISTEGIEARLYDNGIQVARGRLKFEKIPHHINLVNKTKINAYFLYGSSDFYQEIKTASLKDIDVGGERIFAWDDYATSGPGFWGHINTVARSTSPQDYDYCFFPTMNVGWTLFPPPDFKRVPTITNYIIYTGGNLEFARYMDIPDYEVEVMNCIVPYPWLHFVLKRAVEHVGWSIDGDIFTDPDFLKICLINFHAINWGVPFFAWPFAFPLTSVKFNLQDNLPDITVTEFLNGLRKRFGWWYEFDYLEKKITIKKLYSAAVSAVKDMTEYSSPVIPKKVNNEVTIYALKNQFYTDLENGKPKFNATQYQGAVNEITDLPTPDDTIYGHVYLVKRLNNFYILSLSDTDGSLYWKFYTYNIYDYDPPGATVEVTTTATTLGVERYADQGTKVPVSDHIDLLPRIDFIGHWDDRYESEAIWGTILCFYHGIVNSLAGGGKKYNYGSSHIYDAAGNQVAEWALTFECFKDDGTDVGLHALQWKEFLRVAKGDEELEPTLYLPVHKYLQLKFYDQINIAGVLMFIKKIKRIIPYTGQVEIECVRIL